MFEPTEILQPKHVYKLHMKPEDKDYIVYIEHLASQISQYEAEVHGYIIDHKHPENCYNFVCKYQEIGTMYRLKPQLLFGYLRMFPQISKFFLDQGIGLLFHGRSLIRGQRVSMHNIFIDRRTGRPVPEEEYIAKKQELFGVLPRYKDLNQGARVNVGKICKYNGVG